MKTGKFVSGLSNFRIDAIQAHQVLKQHKALTKGHIYSMSNIYFCLP
jgi:hypothetical protein